MNQWTTSTVTFICFFCGRDLSQAISVHYVAEGPICSMCLAKINSAKEQENTAVKEGEVQT